MKNYELLDMIGDVDEDYVLAADGAVRPRFRWKPLAACAACAALITAAAYSALPMLRPNPMPASGLDTQSTSDSAPALEECAPDSEPAEIFDSVLVEAPGLHAYILAEEKFAIRTTEIRGGNYQPFIAYGPGAEDQTAGAAAAPQADSAGEKSVPLDEAAHNQYQGLLQGMLGTARPEYPQEYPDWFGGAWIDSGSSPEARLAVAVVEGLRTPELEEQIRDWCGGTSEIVFTNVKYSENHLYSLMEEIARIFEQLDCGVFLSYGPSEMDNRIDLDFFDVPGDEVLAALNELDPDGDAILIQVFPGRSVSPAAEAGKALEPTGEPALAAEDK